MTRPGPTVEAGLALQVSEAVTEVLALSDRLTSPPTPGTQDHPEQGDGDDDE